VKDRKRHGEGRKSDGAWGPVSSLEGHAINNKNLTSFCTGQEKQGERASFPCPISCLTRSTTQTNIKNTSEKRKKKIKKERKKE